MYSRIAGTGHFAPEKILSNSDLEKLVDTSDEWIRSRSGIERRHLADDDQATSDLAVEASKAAMEAAGVGPDDIDFIVVGTTTPDLVFPNVGCIVQQQLGIHGCAAFSVEAACSGFIYALSIADKFVNSGQARCALVIGAETLSRITDWTDRTTCVLFGDGAGAVILQPSDEAGIISTHLRADGQYRNLLTTTAGISVQPEGAALREGFNVRMAGNEVFKVAVKSLESIVEETLEANGLDRSEIDWLIPHQANMRIIKATAKRLGMPLEKVVLTLRDYGNTSAASVPMALDIAIRDGRIQRGQLLLLEAFGGGFTWGSALVRY
ncbi:MAG: 3-oxoacyl-ACP synthase [Chromatiales bacterium]|jgi:3-oxoacyl-[acyl-carrier-protein] synthase-3|nr:3-oxoacyl-ACP synthase [Chromatiales bacterium]MDP7270840.1 beta-ketoacyl-ACP synthase III [Gammaproteobacteria bacterium]HJP03644.1 beta-ketoacyl-ACP synthase III [Gammaproteobacteria bacterium]